MTEFSQTYALLMPKIKIPPIRQKTKQEEVKEIIQAPNDPLAKYPLRAFGYSNEVGAALSAMPVWGKFAEVALWVPALLYLGADIYDKYSRGKEGNYTKASSRAAVEQAIFQALASVILPTAAVKVGQNIAGYATKFDGSGLTASAKEEMFDRLLDEFDNYNFARGDIKQDGKITVKGIDRVKTRIIDEKLKPALISTRSEIKTEGFFSKLVRFFGHSDRPVASAKTDLNKVVNFVSKEIDAIYNKQTILENSTRRDILASHPEMLKNYDKAVKQAHKRATELIEHKPELIIKKILNSSNPEYQILFQEIEKDFPTIDKRRLLIKNENKSREVINKIKENPKLKNIIEEFAEKIEIARYTLRKQIKAKSMKLGLLKTVGGFVALTCLAVPIDNFVHKYIIKKFIGPGIDTVKTKINDKLVKRNIAGAINTTETTDEAN